MVMMLLLLMMVDVFGFFWVNCENDDGVDECDVEEDEERKN